jgi:predicted RNA binding protein YcfA (HicA-like mRNA interferase family)
MESLSELFQRLRRAKRHVRFRDAERILRRLGFSQKRSKKGTSHHVFSHPRLANNITLVSHGKNDELPMYQIRDIIKALEELESIE